MQNIYDYSYEKLIAYLVENGEKEYRAKQIYSWLYQKKATSFFQMTNLKKDLLEKLTANFSFFDIEIIKKQQSQNATKYLFKLADNQQIEAVLLKQNYGNSLCISSQVGCNLGCAFCASGQVKKSRDLKIGEMVQQLLMIEDEAKIKITHVVIMGIGEPFDNYDNVIDFINIINHPLGLKIGARHITVSTCGLIPQIYQFADDGKQVNLAISLHAANDQLRTSLMPINQRYPLAELMKSVRHYIAKTNRRVTFEYLMLADINDHDKHARELVQLLQNLNCYVNLIPYNKVDNLPFKTTKKAQILRFYDIIKKGKINVTIRKELGADIAAACGQLKSKNKEE